ncbi:ABC transporter ATP-binding protein, partial [archaeon]
MRQRRGGGGDARAADAPPRTPSTEDGETRATSSAHASAWLAHACSRLARPVTDWMTEYNRLLSRAHDLDAAERALCESSGNAKIERRSHRRSPLEAFRDVRSVLMNPSKRQLFSMTFAVVPLPLLAFIALMSMIRPYASLKRTALLASLSETLINSATAHASTVLGVSAGSAAPAAFLNGTNAAAAAAAAPINDSSSSSSSSDGGAFAASDAWSTALSLLAWYIGLFVLEEVADLIQLLAGDTLRYVLEFHGRMTYLSAILVQDAGLIDTRTPAELQQRMAEAPSVMQSLAMMPPRLLQFAFTFGCGLYNMLTMDPLLTLATWLLRLPITLNLTASNHSLLRMHSKLGDDVAMRAATQAAHCITDRRTIQLHAAEEWELHRYGALLLENYHTRRVLRVWEKVVSRLSTVLHLVVHCSTLAVAVTRIAGGYITVPAYRAFESYQHTTANSFENLMHELSQVRTLVERSEIAFTWHYRKPKILAPIQPLSHDTCNRALDAQLPAALRVAASARGVSRAATLAFHELKFDEVLPCADAGIRARQ